MNVWHAVNPSNSLEYRIDVVFQVVLRLLHYRLTLRDLSGMVLERTAILTSRVADTMT